MRLQRAKSQLTAAVYGGGLGTPTGASTNIGGFSEEGDSSSSVMDKNGLGWPAKSTINRLHFTPEQAVANERRLAGAVRTILECLGEDPDRAGLRDTPDRYARALLWMTKGYEEQLCGVYRLWMSLTIQMLFPTLSLTKNTTKWSLSVTLTSTVCVSTIWCHSQEKYDEHLHKLTTDSHWLYSQPHGDWIIQACAHC